MSTFFYSREQVTLCELLSTIEKLNNLKYRESHQEFLLKNLSPIIAKLLKEELEKNKIDFITYTNLKENLYRLQNNEKVSLLNKQGENMTEVNNPQLNTMTAPDNNETYYLVYLTPEEIFNKYIANQSLDDAAIFFEKLCKANNTCNLNIEQAVNLFKITFFIEQYKKSQLDSKDINWSEFKSNLLFSQSLDNYYQFVYHPYLNKESVLPEKIENIAFEYYNGYLGLEEAHLDQNGDLVPVNNIVGIEDLIDNHNKIYDSILDSFNLNEDVKELLYSYQTPVIQKDENIDREIYNIVNNILYNSKITQEKKEKFKELIVATQDNLFVTSQKNNIAHNIIQGLISKDKEQFLTGLEQYTEQYLKAFEINETKDNLSINSIIVLFFSDHLKTILPSNINYPISVFNMLLTHYDVDLFKSFTEVYNIPKNLAVKHISIDDNYMCSLIEYALMLNNQQAAKDMINLGFVMDTFKTKVVKDYTVEDYKYTPFFYPDRLTEDDILFLIENNFIQPRTLIAYKEVIDLGKDEELHNEHAVNSIFYYLLYNNYYDSFIRLYEKSMSSNNVNLKEITHENNLDLLTYYLMVIKKSNPLNYDLNIFDIFIKEKFVIDTINEQNIKSLLKSYDLSISIQIISYLKDIFHNNYKSVQEEAKYLHKKQEKLTVTWFDKDKLEHHFKRIEKEKDSANKEYIKNMLANNSHIKSSLIVNDESFFQTLESQFPNFKEVIQFYKSQFRLKKLSGKNRITPVLLLGEPGIGKTYFAKKLSEYLNTGYTFLDMASITANWILTGNNGTWKSAKQGKILESMMNSSTANPIFLMDELEKAKGGEHDPTMSLYQLLEEVNAKNFTDEFIDFSFDASGIIYIACANTLGNLSEPLQTRFKIFNVPKPNNEQLDIIIQNIYQEGIKDTGIFSTILNEDVVKLLKNQTLRSIKVMIDEAIGKALLEKTMEEIELMQANNVQIVLTLDHFQSPNKKRPMGF